MKEAYVKMIDKIHCLLQNFMPYKMIYHLGTSYIYICFLCFVFYLSLAVQYIDTVAARAGMRIDKVNSVKKDEFPQHSISNVEYKEILIIIYL